MKNILTIITSLFISNSVSAEVNVSNEYVSIDCPKGDITLNLNKNGTFLLSLKYWNKKILKHTHSDKMSGKWKLKNNQLLLSSNKNLIYKRDKIDLTVGEKSASIDSFNWVSSSGETFVDSFTLVERIAVDKLFKSAASKL